MFLVLLFCLSGNGGKEIIKAPDSCSEEFKFCKNVALNILCNGSLDICHNGLVHALL